LPHPPTHMLGIGRYYLRTFKQRQACTQITPSDKAPPSSASLALHMTTLCAPLGAQAASQGTITGTASVIDGDTIDIHGSRIRLHAIDAIESRQKCLLPNGTK
jgi:endonuclease YncB( thermonuclease family)